MRDIIQEIIDLYSDRKISNYSTAQKMIEDLKSDNKRKVSFAIKRFEKKASEWRGNEELGRRMRTNVKKEYAISFLVYGKSTNVGRDSFIDNYGIRHKLIIPDPQQIIVKSSEADRIPSNLTNKYLVNDPYTAYLTMLNKQLKRKDITKEQYKERATVEAFKEANLIPSEPPKRRRLQTKTAPDEVIHDTDLFKKTFLNLINSSKKFKTSYPNIQDYASAIKILDNVDVSGEGRAERITDRERNLRDATDISTYHRYIDTPLDLLESDFNEAMNNDLHNKGECWINSLIDHYHNTLMNPKKWESKRMTREKVIKMIGKTEEEFKEHGASINDMMPVFEYFRFPVRIYSIVGQKIYTYDPEIKNKNIPVFFGMVCDNHIYTLNSNTMSLATTNIEKNLYLNASPNYIPIRNETPTEYKVFNNSNDIIKILKENDERPKEKRQNEFNLIHSDNNLNKVFCDLSNAGYKPKVVFQTQITSMKLKFNKVVFNIKSQNMITDAFDDATVFNKMNSAMFNFGKELFSPSHKSFYTHDDIKILESSRTIVPCGRLRDYGKDKLIKPDLTEIDVRKAFTSAFISIKKVPVFSEFDIWRRYDTEKHNVSTMNELTLYYVKSKKRNIFF